MNGKIVFFVSLVGILLICGLFQLSQDIQNLYERRSSLDIAYAEFLGLHPLTQINPVQSLSDQYFQLAYKNYHFFIYEEDPSDEILSEITSHFSYENHIKEISETPKINQAKNKILNELKNKKTQQAKVFWLLIISDIVVVAVGYSEIKEKKAGMA